MACMLIHLLIATQVDICEKGLKIHKGLVTVELQPLHEKMEKQLKENKAKAAPYRKKQVRVFMFVCMLIQLALSLSLSLSLLWI